MLKIYYHDAKATTSSISSRRQRDNLARITVSEGQFRWSDCKVSSYDVWTDLRFIVLEPSIKWWIIKIRSTIILCDSAVKEQTKLKFLLVINYVILTLCIHERYSPRLPLWRRYIQKVRHCRGVKTVVSKLLRAIAYLQMTRNKAGIIVLVSVSCAPSDVSNIVCWLLTVQILRSAASKFISVSLRQAGS